MRRWPAILIVTLLVTLNTGSGRAETIDIGNEELQRLLAEGVPLVDLRRSDEWRDTGVIHGSRLITFFDVQGSYDAPAWQKALTAVAGSEDPVILICRSGSRSGMVSDWLSEDQGYATVYNVTDGILSWIRSGHTTVAP